MDDSRSVRRDSEAVFWVWWEGWGWVGEESEGERFCGWEEEEGEEGAGV